MRRPGNDHRGTTDRDRGQNPWIQQKLFPYELIAPPPMLIIKWMILIFVLDTEAPTVFGLPCSLQFVRIARFILFHEKEIYL